MKGIYAITPNDIDDFCATCNADGNGNIDVVQFTKLYLGS